MRAWPVAAFVALLVLSAAFGPHAAAGTKAAPEITDPADDQATISGGAPACPQGSGAPATNNCFANADLLAGWVDSETTTQFKLHILVTGTAAPSSLGTSYDWDFYFTIAGKTYDAKAHLDGTAEGNNVQQFDGALTFSGAAKTGEAKDSIITFNILRADVGSPPAGAVAEKILLSSTAYAASTNAFVADAASGGKSYTFTQGAGATPAAGGNNTTSHPPTTTPSSTAPPAAGNTTSAAPSSSSGTAPTTTASGSAGPTSSASGPTTTAKKSGPAAFAALVAGCLAGAAALRRRI